MQDAKEILSIALSVFGIVSALFAALWAYVRFVVRPAIMAEVQGLCVANKACDDRHTSSNTQFAIIQETLRDVLRRLERLPALETSLGHLHESIGRILDNE
jgi:hypothetical protein